MRSKLEGAVASFRRNKVAKGALIAATTFAVIAGGVGIAMNFNKEAQTTTLSDSATERLIDAMASDSADEIAAQIKEKTGKDVTVDKNTIKEIISTTLKNKLDNVDLANLDEDTIKYLHDYADKALDKDFETYATSFNDSDTAEDIAGDVADSASKTAADTLTTDLTEVLNDIKTLKKAVKNVSEDVTDLKSLEANDVASLNSSISKLMEKASKDAEAISTLEKTIKTKQSEINTDLGKLETAIAQGDKKTADDAKKDLENKVAALKKLIKNNKTLLQGKITDQGEAFTKKLDAVSDSLDNYKSTNDTALKTAVAQLNSDINTITQRLNGSASEDEKNMRDLTEQIALEKQAVNNATNELKQAVESQNEEMIKTAEENLKNAVAALNETISKNEALLKDNYADLTDKLSTINTIITDYEVSNDQALTDAVQSLTDSLTQTESGLNTRLEMFDLTLRGLSDREATHYSKFIQTSESLKNNINAVSRQVATLQDETDIKNLRKSLFSYVKGDGMKGWVASETCDTKNMTIAQYVETLAGNDNTYAESINDLYTYTKDLKNSTDAQFTEASNNIKSLYNITTEQMGYITELQKKLAEEKAKTEKEINDRVLADQSIKRQISSNTDAVNAALKDLEKAMTDGDNKSVELAATNLSKAVTELNKTIVSNYEILSEAQKTSADKLLEQLIAVQKELQNKDISLDADISNLSQRITDMNTTITGITDGLQEKIDILNESLSTTNQNLSTTNSNVSAIGDRVTSLETDTATMNQNISDLGASLDGCRLYYQDGHFYVETEDGGTTVTKKLD